jgi:hypothetical protein
MVSPEEVLEHLRRVVAEQAEDPRLWPSTAAVEDLQLALRLLHEIVEGVSREECALRAIERAGLTVNAIRTALEASGLDSIGFMTADPE